jgi:hypothetical protein
VEKGVQVSELSGLSGDMACNLYFSVMGVSRGKMPLESNGVGINSPRLPAESVVSAFQHITYTTYFSKSRIIGTNNYGLHSFVLFCKNMANAIGLG